MTSYKQVYYMFFHIIKVNTHGEVLTVILTGIYMVLVHAIVSDLDSSLIKISLDSFKSSH